MCGVDEIPNFGFDLVVEGRRTRGGMWSEGKGGVSSGLAFGGNWLFRLRPFVIYIYIYI